MERATKILTTLSVVAVRRARREAISNDDNNRIKALPILCFYKGGSTTCLASCCAIELENTDDDLRHGFSFT
jgi:hypothetical protein